MTIDRENQQVVPEGYQFPPGRESAEVLTYVVDHHYFDTFGVRLLAGRSFRATDRIDSAPVVIVNEAFAKQYLGPNPIGKRIRLVGRTGTFAEVVGVTVTGKSFLLIEPAVQVIYLPLGQNPRSTMTLIAETAGDPAAQASPLQAMARSVDPKIPILRVRTMEDLFERSSVNMIRTVERIYDSGAAMGLLLALVGLSAVVSYQVARRTREIGIRMALGAERVQVTTIFLKQAAAMSVTGVSIGLAVGIYANSLSESAVGYGRLDPLLLLAVSLALLLTAVAASFIPARRAAQIDPQQALRQD
jgi:ABC-type antimicrobial peptide transport system permease subunit